MQRYVLLSFMGVALGWAQTPAAFEDSVRAAMASSIAQQRTAARKQALAVKTSNPAAAEDPFFLVPFAKADAGGADCDPLPKAELNSLIESAAQKSGVDSELVRAVIEKESG